MKPKLVYFIYSKLYFRVIYRVLQAGTWNFERGQKRSKIRFLGLKMIIFGHFLRFLVSFKISFSSLQHPSYIQVFFKLYSSSCNISVKKVIPKIYGSNVNGCTNLIILNHVLQCLVLQCLELLPFIIFEIDYQNNAAKWQRAIY